MIQPQTIVLDHFRVKQIDRSLDKLLQNLLELYCHDMSEWFLFDANTEGLYTYSTEDIWQNNNIDVYVVYDGDIPAGFCLIDTDSGKSSEINTDINNDINSSETRVIDLEEFFIVRRYRKLGLGAAFAVDLWQRYAGLWLVRVYQNNLPALPFWRNIINRHSNGHSLESVCLLEGKSWSHFTFEQR